MSNRVISWLTPESMHRAAVQMRDQTLRDGQEGEPQLHLVAARPPSRYGWQWVGEQSMRRHWHEMIVRINCPCTQVIVELTRCRYLLHGSQMTLWFGQCQQCHTCYYHSDAAPIDGMLPNVTHGEFSIAADLLEEHGFPEIAAAVRKMERTPEESPTSSH